MTEEFPSHEPNVEFANLMEMAADADAAGDIETRDAALRRIDELSDTGQINIEAIRQMAEADKKLYE